MYSAKKRFVDSHQRLPSLWSLVITGYQDLSAPCLCVTCSKQKKHLLADRWWPCGGFISWWTVTVHHDHHSSSMSRVISRFIPIEWGNLHNYWGTVISFILTVFEITSLKCLFAAGLAWTLNYKAGRGGSRNFGWGGVTLFATPIIYLQHLFSKFHYQLHGQSLIGGVTPRIRLWQEFASNGQLSGLQHIIIQYTIQQRSLAKEWPTSSSYIWHNHN